MGNTLYKACLKDFFKFCQSREITVGMMVLTSTGFSSGLSNVTFAEIEDAKGLEAGIASPTGLHLIGNRTLVCSYEIMNSPMQLTLVSCGFFFVSWACHLAKSAFKEAITKMDT
ncbi:hypothetical protein MKW92_023901 [Papaver armeniacum]|nr:hypothetical protein MKW92_023901 [Papaver armeniacum]